MCSLVPLVAIYQIVKVEVSIISTLYTYCLNIHSESNSYSCSLVFNIKHALLYFFIIVVDRALVGVTV